MRIVRLLLWIVWAFAAAAAGFVVWAFAYYRPTVEYRGVEVDPQSVNGTFAIGVTTSLLALGFGLRILLKRRNSDSSL